MTQPTTVLAPAAAREVALQLQRYAFIKLTRELDSRFENLLLTGRVAKWYSEVGNEATTVPAGLALRAGDVLCTLHRDLGAILAQYLDPVRTFPGLGLPGGGLSGGGYGAPDVRPEPEDVLYRLACQLLGKGDGFSQGIERSFHYGWLDPAHGIRHVGMISHLGSMIPVAAGCAFALKQSGTDGVAVNFIGDGGTSTGDFHEGLNMAAVWRLPLVLVVENNRYAFSTPTRLQYACRQLADRGPGYGIAAATVDGNDPDAMAAAYDQALARARAGEGPTLIEAMLGRMRGHAEGDGSLKVVPEPELAGYLAADPVPAYAKRLERDGVLAPDVREAIDRRCAELVERCLERALAAAPPAAEVAWRPVFAPLTEEDRDENVRDQSSRGSGEHGERAADAIAPQTGDIGTTTGAVVAAPSIEPVAMAAFAPDAAPAVRTTKAAGGEQSTYLDAIHQALREEMERDERVVLMGQDIGAFEGAFRVTRGLFARWPERVLDTPIAEAGTVGIAAGAALLGYRPVVEMQFADFVSNAFNQLVNVAAKLYYRFGVPCPLVVRLPSGGGVGAGPFHSQNPEGWFAHAGGLKVVCPATARDARALMKAAIRDPNPVIFCEHKFLYRRIKESLPAGESLQPLGGARVAREGSDVTLVGYGATTWTCLEAAELLEKDGVAAEVVDLRALVPYDEATVLASVQKTSRAVVVHEDLLTAGFGAEVAARLADAAFPWLDAPVKRVAYPDRPSPYAKVLEAQLLPNVDKVLAAAREVLTY
ncbi:MAG TPA: dehydrogenase E1 component subunit alpha/beta [Thermoanaerobaculia bacterium]|jgi:2-oxoisovalerate dehydrogenase E1 component|nr:dehydrogenase E1 component subunit alpha/beta [Thermoanaerobaculia bacterium]